MVLHRKTTSCHQDRLQIALVGYIYQRLCCSFSPNVIQEMNAGIDLRAKRKKFEEARIVFYDKVRSYFDGLVLFAVFNRCRRNSRARGSRDDDPKLGSLYIRSAGAYNRYPSTERAAEIIVVSSRA